MKWIGQHIYDLVSRFRDDVYLEDVDSSSDTQILVRNSTTGKVTYNTSAGGEVDQNLWVRFESDSGVTSANTTTDTFTIAGGTNCSTAISGDTVTINSTNTNQLTTFTLRADSGSNQTISHGNTLDIAGGSGISTTTTATDQANIIIDAAQTTISSILKDDGLTVGTGTDSGTNITFTEAQIRFLYDNVIKMYGTASAFFGEGINLGSTGTRWAQMWLSENCTAASLVAETSLTLDSVVFTTVQTETEVASSFANNDTSIMTGAAANERFRKAYFPFEGYGVGDGSNFLIPVSQSSTRAPFQHEESAGSDGLTALNPTKLLKAAGAYMPYSGTCRAWKGWATSNTAGGSGTMYITLFKYSPVADTATADSLEVLAAHSFTSSGNNNLLAISKVDDEFTETEFTAGDILMTGIKGIASNTVNFNSMLEVEFD
jgi:hypothetical protein